MSKAVHSVTTRDVTVDYLANLGEAARCRVTIPAGTRVERVVGGAGGWAVDDVPLLIKLTSNSHDPKYRFCFVPDDAVRDGGNFEVAGLPHLPGAGPDYHDKGKD